MIRNPALVRELFDAARARPAAEREDWLSRSGHEAAVLHEVRELLRFADRETGPFDTPLLDGTRLALARDGALPEPAPERVGSYEIVATLGRGSTGTVFEALQLNPRRTVALKLLREGLASDSALRRFQLEVDALGRLDHPYVASILEAGTTDTGRGQRPYLVMEKVDGEPLSRAAAVLRASPSERIELLARLAEGVAHAHSRGVVHRDLKPDNVLVDGELRPRILDFGVARLLEWEPDGRDGAHATAPGILVGTLAYMSPEQAAGDASRIDTRSDVYALGVLGYELLTGGLPYDVAGLDLPDALRVVTERDGPLAGTRVPSLAGDVETILAMAMQKEPARRYQSAAELAADLRRHLADEPIVARPASATDQLRRFARKHRALVAAAGAGLLLLLVAVVALAWGLHQARERGREGAAHLAAEQVARRAEGEARTRLQAEQQATLAAQRELHGALADAEALLDFATGVLLAVRPEARGWDVRVGDLLDAAAERAAASGATAAVRARMDGILGRAYLALGRYGPGREHLERALDGTRGLVGSDDPAALELQRLLGQALRGLTLASAARDVQADHLERMGRARGADHAATLASERELATTLHHLGEHAAAEERLRSVAARAAESLGADHDETLSARLALVRLLLSTGRPDEARELATAVHEGRRRTLGDGHLLTLDALREVVRLDDIAGDAVLTLAGQQALHDGYVRALGPEHPETLDALSGLGRAHESLGHYDEALAAFDAAIDGLASALGADHGLTLLVRRRRAELLIRLDRMEQAESALRALLAVREGQPETQGWSHAVRRSLGFVLMARGDFAGARRELEAALAGLRAVHAGPFVETAHVLMDISNVDMNEGLLAPARQRLREAQDMYAALLGDGHEDRLAARMNLARAEALDGRLDEAEALLLDVIPRLGESLGSDHPSVLRALLWLAQAWIDGGRPEEALAILDGVVEGLRPSLAPTHALVLEARWSRVDALIELGRFDEAEAGLDAVARDLGLDADAAALLPSQMARRVRLHLAAGRLDQARNVVARGLAAAGDSAPGDAAAAWELRYCRAEIQIQAGERTEAEVALASLHGAAASLWGPQGWDARRAASRLVELCTAQGRLADADAWRSALGEGGPVPSAMHGR